MTNIEEYRLWLGRLRASAAATLELAIELERAEPHTTEWYVALAAVQAGNNNVEDNMLKVMSLGKCTNVEPD